jgi:hypothetical protein
VYNINEFDRLFRRTLEKAGLTGSVVNLELERIPARTLRVLTHVTVEDKTSALTKCRLAIKSGRGTHYLDELTTIAADELAVSRSDILLGEGDIFLAEMTGTTTNDKLVMTCVGWEKDL